MLRQWLGLCLLTCYLDVIASQACPNGWKEHGSSCYLFVLPTLRIRAMSWEDSRADCLGYGGDLVSIRNSSEVNFIYQQTKTLGNYIFWIGLYRNKTTSDPKEGWIWIDGNNFTNPQQWRRGEPNNYQNNEKCAEFFASNKLWNDNNCDKLFAWICKRKKGIPLPTFPTAGTFPPTKDPPPRCDHGWIAHNRSCYRFFSVPKSWNNAKRACRDTGGHLVRVDNADEQHFLTYSVRPKRENFWIGLNDLEVAGRWVWEFLSNDPLNFKNWQSGEPNNLGVERCVEMYGFAQAGFWNDASCYGRKSYICEKEEGLNMCPEGWIPYNDTCYQFNMGSSQKMNWAQAAAACTGVGGFASLVKITSQSEQDFITRRIQLGSSVEVWIGLNDISHENIFKWTADSSELVNTDYKLWANGKPSENKDSKDCVMILGVRKDGAWSVQDCSLKRNFICMRHRDLPFCNAPLGMENGKISDSQITASSSLSAANGPEQARYRHSGSWCPAKANKNEYLQVELPFLADIRKIATQGNVTSYTLKVSKDGKKFKDYVTSTRTKQLTPRKDIVDIQSLKAKFVRLYPYQWNDYPCLRVDFVGCAAQAPTSSECQGNNWEKGPGNLCFQVNRNYRTWPDARSVCLDQGGDLLTITTNDEKKAISDRIKKMSFGYFWISLNDRDYRNHFYWSNNDANGLINWGSGAPDNSGNTNKKACVAIKTSWNNGLWKDHECSTRLPFICMKGEPYANRNLAQTGPTGMWMGSAKYYWPLSAIENKKIVGTRLGNVSGKVTLTTGVKEKPDTALQFTGAGSYIDLGNFEKECFISPDYCSYGLTLSFMASFDTTAVSWSNRVNILGFSGDENKFLGLSVYIQSQKLWFVVSKISKYFKTSVSIVDHEWRYYVMKWNDSLGIAVTVNGQDTSSTSITKTKDVKNNQVNSFKIGPQKTAGVTSGQVNLAMVAFWDKVLSKRDISLIYKAEFGTCPFSWLEYGMSCYQFNQDRRSYYSATTQCQSLGGDLVDIRSTVENTFVSTRAQAGEPWIGAHDKGNEGVFVGTDNKMIPYSNWNVGQPDNWWRREDCVHMKTRGTWNDLPCYHYRPYICEKPKEIPVKPTNITTTAAPIKQITKVQFICHYSTMTIGCPSGLVIKINSAFWGRREKGRCTYVSVKPCGLKDIPQTTKQLGGKCDHYGKCELRASETEPYLTNPCPTIHKYLEVNYTCVKDTSDKKCNPGWKSFGNKCYRLYDTPKTWKEARGICKKSGGELLSIAGDREQQLATSLMERAWYSDVWIGLNDLKTKGVYEWSDNSSVSFTAWYVGQPDERRTDKSCVYMSLMRSKLGWMYWRDDNCSTIRPFMCSNGTTQKPATVPTAYKGECKSGGWVTSKSLRYCYFYKSSAWRTSWRDALSQCLVMNANLVSIHSKEENEFVRKLSNNTFWLGLDGIGVFRGHSWSDNQPVRYTNWAIGQPDSYSGLEGCVQMNPDTGLWSDRSCDEKQDVVCKTLKRLTRPTAAPVVYPTPGSSLCKKGWTLYQGMCYIVGTDSSYEYVTWLDAEKKCQGFNGHLTSITSEDEQKFLQFLVKGRNSRDYWIGLNDLGSEANYKWSDYSNYNYANWDSREPNDYYRQEDCVHMISANGRWNDHHCQKRFSYICKANNETYKPPAKPTPPPRPQTDGYCPPGWIVHAQYCYEFHTDPSDYRNWDDARDACEKGLNSSSDGELASIHDEFELAFITTHIKVAMQWLWLGMTNRHGAYFWVDNSIANYFNWNTREPVAWGYGRCVEIVPYRWAAGRWNAAYCWKKNGYICKKAALDKPVTPTPTKAPDCPSSYKSYEESCFKFVKTKKTFEEARKECKKDVYGGQKGDLMIVDSQFKQAYLIYLLERYIGNVWIGFLHEPYSVFKFVDHSSAIYTYWGPGQPNRQLGQRSCTQANVTGSNLGVWDDVECSTTNSFVCEIYKGDPKVTIPINGTCPVGWRIYDKYCYKHFSLSQTWAQAQYLCSSVGAHLVSIHDDNEQDFLIHFYQDRHPISIWTGLNDRALERGYKWVDNSPLDYLNWGEGEPSDSRGYENCVEMQSRSGRWNDLSCSRYRQYMCKKKLECSSVIALDPSMVSVTDTNNATTSGADKAIITDNSVSNTAWCTNNTSGTSKITISLNQLVRITGISVMGLSSRQFVKSFRIEYERDEILRRFYPNKDSQSTIQGNRWGGQIVTRNFKYPVTLDGLSIIPVTWVGNLICMKIRLYGCSYVCQKQLFSNIPALVKSDVITASSAEYPKNEPKQAAVLGNAWCAKTNDKKQWIQFNFDKVKQITAVRTFGDRNDEDNYVMSYSLQFSASGNNWTYYVQAGIKRIFKGNNDGVSPMFHNLPNQIDASYVRIIPLKWNKKICMRISLLGCEADCSKPLLANDKISSFDYLSSDNKSNPRDALFNTGKAWCTGQIPLAQQYLEINFGKKFMLSKIATQPSPPGYGKGGEVSAITITYKKRKGWINYGPDSQPKILTAVNLEDKSKPMFNVLKDYIRNNDGLKTRAIRIYPNVYNGTTVCMRVELYGCPADYEIIPTTPSTAQEVVDVSVRFTSIDWNDKLTDRKSKEFAVTSAKIIEAVESVYKDSKSFRSATVVKLSKGSVISRIRMVFNPEFSESDNVTLPLETAVRSGKVGSLEVDKESLKRLDDEIIKITPSIPPTSTHKSVMVSVRFTSIEWNDKMSNTKSKEFATTSAKIIEAVKNVYAKSEYFQSAKVVKLSKGSVIAKIKLVYNPEIADGDNVTSLLETAVKSGKVGSLEVDKKSFKKLEGMTQASTGDDSGGLSGGAVAGIVITVLILVAVAAGFGFVLYRRKILKSPFSPRHFDNPISYSAKAYDMDD